MAKTPPESENDDDEVESSRAPLLDHLIELRKRLIIVAGALLVAFLICFFLSEKAFELLVEPYYRAQLTYSAAGGADIRVMADAPDLIFSGPLEFFLVKVKLALLGAIAIGFPILAWQIYAFVAPGLYKRERAALLPFLLAMPVLFALGTLVVYYLTLPAVMNFSLRQQYSGENVTIGLLLRVDDYFSLATALILAFGAAFQLPVVLSLLGKAGIVSAAGLRKAWRYAVVIIFVISSFLTPTDPVSLFILAVPVLGLYEVSIWCVKLFERKREEEEAAFQAEQKKQRKQKKKSAPAETEETPKAEEAEATETEANAETGAESEGEANEDAGKDGDKT